MIILMMIRRMILNDFVPPSFFIRRMSTLLSDEHCNCVECYGHDCIISGD